MASLIVFSFLIRVWQPKLVHFRIHTMSQADRNLADEESTIFEISEAFGGESEPGNGRPVGPATPPAPASRVRLLPPRGVPSGLRTRTRKEKKVWGRKNHSGPSNPGFPGSEILKIQGSGLGGCGHQPRPPSGVPQGPKWFRSKAGVSGASKKIVGALGRAGKWSKTAPKRRRNQRKSGNSLVPGS